MIISAVYQPLHVHIWYVYCPLINTPILRGVIIQPKNPFLGVIFDEDPSRLLRVSDKLRR